MPGSGGQDRGQLSRGAFHFIYSFFYIKKEELRQLRTDILERPSIAGDPPPQKTMDHEQTQKSEVQIRVTGASPPKENPQDPLLEVGNQASGVSNATGMSTQDPADAKAGRGTIPPKRAATPFRKLRPTESANPFEKKGLARTPPETRLAATQGLAQAPKTTGEEVSEPTQEEVTTPLRTRDPTARKRTIEEVISPTTTAQHMSAADKRRKETKKEMLKEMQEYDEAMAKVTKTTRSLDVLCAKYGNTQSDIKANVNKLATAIKNLVKAEGRRKQTELERRENFKDVLEISHTEDEVNALKYEIEALKRQNAEMVADKETGRQETRQLTSSETQTRGEDEMELVAGECIQEQDILAALKSAETLKDAKDILNRIWPTNSEPEPKEVREARTVREIWKRIEAAKTEEALEAAMKETWPKAMYTKTRISKTSIQGDKHARVVVVADDSEKDSATLTYLAKQVPGLARAQSNLPIDTVATIKSHHCVTIGNEEAREDNQELPRILVLTKIASAKVPNDQLVHTLATMVFQLRADGYKSAAFSLPSELNSVRARKLLEVGIGQQMDFTADLCYKRKEKTANGETEKKIKKMKKGTMSSTVDIDTRNLSYADTLKEMKKNIKPESSGVVIQKVYKTASGGMRMQLKETKAGGRHTFAKVIRDNTDAEVTIRSPASQVMTIVIQDLDETTTTEELKDAIEACGLRIKEEPEDYKVEEPKKGHRDAWTARLRLPKAVGEALLKARRRIRVGWSVCRITEMVRPPLCFKCQEVGHLSRDCEEKEQKEKRCYKCDGVGHIAKDCNAQEAKCHTCQTNGHTNTSMACPKYRELVKAMKSKAAEMQEARKREAKKNKTTPAPNQQAPRRRGKVQEATEEQWKEELARSNAEEQEDQDDNDAEVAALTMATATAATTTALRRDRNTQ